MMDGVYIEETNNTIGGIIICGTPSIVGTSSYGPTQSVIGDGPKSSKYLALRQRLKTRRRKNGRVVRQLRREFQKWLRETKCEECGIDEEEHWYRDNICEECHGGWTHFGGCLRPIFHCVC